MARDVSRSAIKKLCFFRFLILISSLYRSIDPPRENRKYYILLDHFEVSAVAQDSIDFGKEAVPL